LLHGEGVDLDEYAFAPLPQRERFVFILIGRLLWDKGVAEYVEAARRLRAKYPHARFQLLGPVGVDNPSAISRTEVDAWERDNVIEYLGEAHDVRPHIANADCVVLPSYREGVPRTLMEASAMGRPVVATDVPGCREVVEDGVTGFLCEAKNADSLAGTLERMLTLGEAQRAAMGVKGRENVAREFDEKVVVERYKGTIRAITGVSL
jgi:glycosyltransferase involved in cell wall biosynthesis